MLQRRKYHSFIRVHENDEEILINLDSIIHIKRTPDGRAVLSLRDSRLRAYTDETFEHVADLLLVDHE